VIVEAVLLCTKHRKKYAERANQYCSCAIAFCLFVSFLTGCALEQTIGDRLAKPDGDGSLQADLEVDWQSGDMLDARHTVTMGDGTQIACFVMEPWAYELTWGRDLDLSTREKLLADTRKRGRTLKQTWGGDKFVAYFRSLNKSVQEEKIQSLDYRVIAPKKSEKLLNAKGPIAGKEPVRRFVPPPLRGTVILIQGWHAPVIGVPYLRPLACALSNAGYRVVMPDVRGQGASGGRYRGFGGPDARDMAEVVTALTDQGVIEGPLYAVGHSYGGMLALLWGLEDDRVQAVIALSPLHDGREAFPYAIRGLAKRSDSLASWLLDGFVSDQTLRAGFDHAGKIAGTDLTQAT